MKKFGIGSVSFVSFLLIILAFVLSVLGFGYLGFDVLPGLLFSYAFPFLSLYVILILHELGHAFCGYLTGYRLVALGLGSFLWTKKADGFHFSKSPSLKNVGAQYVGVKKDETDQRILLMFSGGLLVHLTLFFLALLAGFLTGQWYLAGVWMALNLGLFLGNALPVGIIDGAKIWELWQHPENVPYAYQGLRHGAATLLTPESSDLKDFAMAVPEEARGGMAETIYALQGEIALIQGDQELAKARYQHLLDQSDNSVIQSLAGVSLLHLALLEDDYEKAQELAKRRSVRSMLNMKQAGFQIIAAEYQWKIKQDKKATQKALTIAKKQLDSSRMLRDEKTYYRHQLEAFEEAVQGGH